MIPSFKQNVWLINVVKFPHENKTLSLTNENSFLGTSRQQYINTY